MGWIQKSKTGRTIYATFALSHDEDRQVVRMTCQDDPSFGIVAVNNDPAKNNGHPPLYRRLKAILENAEANDPS